MRLLIVAGPPTVGKTTFIEQIVKNFKEKWNIAYLKIDVVKTFDDVKLSKEYNIATRKVFSGDLCPDHAEVMVLGDAIKWAKTENTDLLIVESAGLCLRCSPFLNQGLGVVVVCATSGIFISDKMSVMISLADVAVVTKIDLVSQVEREVLLEKIREEHPNVSVFETNALQGMSLQMLYKIIQNSAEISEESIELKGNPPLGTCTICVGKKEIGWQNHFGIVRKLDGGVTEYFYRGD